ncbi:Immunoglobulin I-set, partial [Trinorchestia longiramus]
EHPVVFPMSFNSEQFLEGDMAQANCILQKGDQPLLISWLFNGKPLGESDHVKILKVGRSSILTIDPVKGLNQGNYTCIASNPAGQMSVHAHLFVNG